MAELSLIRHAPSQSDGKLCGRRDVAADLSGAPVGAVRAYVGEVSQLLTSPAKRCRQTAAALFPDRLNPPRDDRLWEQDFGDWEGLAFADLPDLGVLEGQALADHTPPGGESFSALCQRVTPALCELAQQSGHIVIVAHAGTVRAALSLALGGPAAALRFDIAPLSVTRVHCLPDGSFSILGTNWTPS